MSAVSDYFAGVKKSSAAPTATATPPKAKIPQTKTNSNVSSFFANLNKQQKEVAKAVATPAPVPAPAPVATPTLPVPVVQAVPKIPLAAGPRRSMVAAPVIPPVPQATISAPTAAQNARMDVAQAQRAKELVEVANRKPDNAFVAGAKKVAKAPLEIASNINQFFEDASKKKGLVNLVQQTGATAVSQVNDAAKFVVDYIDNNPTKLLGPISKLIPENNAIDRASREAKKKLQAEGKDTFAIVAKQSKERAEAGAIESEEWKAATTQEKFTKYLPETIYNLVPSVAGSILPYLASGGLGFVVAIGSTAEDVKQKALESGVDERKAENLALLTGVAVGTLDRIIPNKVLPKDAKRNFIGGFFKRLIKSSVGEPLTEVAQENIQIAAEATFRDDLGWDEIKSRNAMSALGGLFGGAGMQSVGTIAGSISKEGVAPNVTAQPEVTPQVEGQAPIATETPASPVSPSPVAVVPTQQAPIGQEQESSNIQKFFKDRGVEVKPETQTQAQKPSEVTPTTPIERNTLNEVNELSKTAQQQARQSFTSDPQTAGQRAKAEAMQFAAIRRGIEGKPTDIEIRNARQFLDSNFTGKSVVADGKSGIVQRPSFGRIGVRLEDGTTKYFLPEQITSPAATDENVIAYLREEAQNQLEDKRQTFGAVSQRSEVANPKIPAQRVAPIAVTPADTATATERKAKIPTVPVKKIELKDSDIQNRVMNELTYAEAGERVMTRDAGSGERRFSAKRSTFPSWVPADLRRKPLLDAVSKHIVDGTIPTKAAELRLYRLVAAEMESENDVINDAEFVANERRNLIDPFATDEENAKTLAKFDEEYAKLKANQNGIPNPSAGEVSQVGATIQAEGKQVSEARPQEPVATVETKVEPEAKPEPEPKAPKKEVSRVYDRLKAEDPNLTEEVDYEVQSLKENAEKAVQLIEDDRQTAYRIAMGVIDPPSGQTATAVNIALAEKALADGNNTLYGQLTVQRSLAQTRRGQEIVAEKGSVKDNSTSRYVKELVQSRLDKLGRGYLGSLSPSLLRKSKGSRATAAIDAEVVKVKDRIKTKKEFDLDEAQAFLDSLACK